ncbi:MAG: REP-associated tyrosine transposase [Bacillota bacterium]
MARKPRIQYPGAFYHIIVRGNQRQNIFLDDADRLEYIKRLKRYKQKCGFILYAYVLMSNHVHLLLETPKDPIARIMQMINFTYTQYFNKKYNKVGHLFQGRYKSYLCDKDNYLLGLVRYIHKNPVRAGLVKLPEEYHWSSQRDYIDGVSELVDAEKVLRIFSERLSIARKKYKEFMSESEEDEGMKYYKTTEQQIVGDERFIDRVDRELKREEKLLRKITIKEIEQSVKEITGFGLSEMNSSKRSEELRIARGVLIAIAKRAGFSLTELQSVIGRDISVLSRMSANAETDKGRKILEKVIVRLNA